VFADVIVTDEESLSAYVGKAEGVPSKECAERQAKHA